MRILDAGANCMLMVFAGALVSACADDPPTARPSHQHAAEIVWSGRTIGNPLLRADTLALIRPLTPKCKEPIASVHTEIVDLVAGLEFVTPSRPKRTVERWLVGLCGLTEAFAVRWTATADGGSDIEVSHWEHPGNAYRKKGDSAVSN